MSGEKRKRVVAVVQARSSSERLPAKVLREIAGEPMLARVVGRASRARRVDEVLVATSDRPDDDAVEALARARGFRCVRGSLDDVLDRFRKAAEVGEADVVVRITGDCPLIDPAVMDRVIETFLAADPPVDYASNVWPERTFPRGLDTEVFSREALEASAREAREPGHREHVTQYILRNPARFATVNVVGEVDHSRYRWTVDTPEDLELVQRIYGALPDANAGMEAVLGVLREHPEWAQINAHVEQKKV